MFGGPKAAHRVAAGVLIASTILVRPSACGALDKITLITDFGYNGRHAYFFDALDRGYYRDAGLDVNDGSIEVGNAASIWMTPLINKKNGISRRAETSRDFALHSPPNFFN
jgi:hypothetical protein